MTVAITYRTDGAWGSGIGVNLTAAQVDGNFFALAQAIDDLASNPATPIQIAAFNISGVAMTIVMSDGSTVGPLPLPVLSWRWRADWAPFVPYLQLDVFKVENTGIFLVLVPHTAAATFDAAATDSNGNPLYKELLGTAIPAAGGTTGQILRKASNADNDTVWQDAPLPIAFFVPGLPASNAISRAVTTEAGTFAANFAGSYGPARVAATSAATITVNINGSPIGDITYAGGSSTPVLATVGAAPFAFAAGDLIELAFPSTPDATLADVAITLRAIRS
jgi:hypothetical protein